MARKPAGLSAAEISARDALLEKTKEEEQERKAKAEERKAKEEQEKTKKERALLMKEARALQVLIKDKIQDLHRLEIIRSREEKSRREDAERQERAQRRKKRQEEIAEQRQGYGRFESTKTEENNEAQWHMSRQHSRSEARHTHTTDLHGDRSLQPDEVVVVQGQPFPTDLRKSDWRCPDCGFSCFGKCLTCPCCKAPRPGVVVVNEPIERPGGARTRAGQISEMSREPGKRGHWRTREPSPLGAEVNRNQSSPGLEQPFGRSGWKTAPRYGARYQSQEQQEQKTSPGDMEQPQDLPTSKARRQHSNWGAHEPKAQGQDDIYDDELPRDMRQQRDSQAGKANKSNEGRKQRDSVDDDFDPDEYRARRDQRKQMKREKARQREVEHQGPSPLYLPAFISVSNLADVIGIRHVQFIRHLHEMGFEGVTHNHILDAETAGLVATEFNFDPVFDVPDDDLVAAPEPEDKSTLPSRPPVVTIMGHVDHGKTTILDWLRHSSVAASEHGGITQHIGAFSVPMPSGKMITFLDTPGHEAFLEMRRRGADVTDIVVLVVAADDSVKPQTIEAIKHAASSRVPVIVAMSKIDKPGINTEKLKQDLSVHGVHVEDYGGDVQAIGVSGKTGQGMLELEEAIITLSEVLDHRADEAGNVEGWVIEASTKSHGRVATALIRRGTLRPGDVIVAGTTWTRVRTLRNEAGVTVEEATPGMPVEIDGWREQPVAGTEFLQASNEQLAKRVVEIRQEKSETERLGEDTAAMNKARSEHLHRRRLEQAGEEYEVDQGHSGPKKISFIVKADVGGSAEAVMNSIAAVGNNEVYANVLRSAVGPVSEFDIEHAASANGHLICFNQPIDPPMVHLAEKRGVPIMDHNVIYKLVDDVKGVLSEHLPPLVTQRVTGEAEISQIFEISVKRRETTTIAGCKVRNGVINRTRKVRVLRGRAIVYDGKLLLSTDLLWTAVSDNSRHDRFPEERQEGRERNAQRHRMRYGFRRLG